jgi:1-acyl-sn-glycerol-3-phosphate acyltransferase
MKIKTKDISYEDFLNLPTEKRLKPLKPSILFRTLLKIVSSGDLKVTHFTHKEYGMEKLGHKEPALFLMNHSSFIDLKIASTILYPRPFNIICTEDGLIGQSWLLRHLGCIPTKKFVTDYHLFNDMKYAVDKGSSILMYPEASYSFDGTATILPKSLGRLLKLLNVPVVMIKTHGAFLRDPLYNALQLRQVDVDADMIYLLSKEDIEEKSIEELNKVLQEQFEFDNFKYQQEHNIIVNEPFRADYLNRVLYKCPHCGSEHHMVGKGIHLECKNCSAKWELTENGFLKAINKEEKFTHVPDWYKWERECVKNEIEAGTYKLDTEVDIRAIKGMKCLYNIGKGRLIHDKNGFHLTGCDGKLDFKVSPKSQYSLYSDYFWYELGDMIAVGDSNSTFYCFPPKELDVAAKTRLAVEELAKLLSIKK